jgi:cytidylate kinase
MSIITISREYGSDGRSVALKSAELLGYLCMNKDLLVEVAREAQVPVSEVERYDERPEHPALRVLRKFLTPGHPDALTGLSEYEWWATASMPELAKQQQTGLPILDEESFVQSTREVMLRLVERGRVVLVGRGSQALLSHQADVLHARIIAPLSQRIEWVIKRDQLDKQEAEKQIRKYDERRGRYVKRHYGVDWSKPEHYHLTLNTGHTGVEAAARTIVEAVKHLSLGQPPAI